jgi:hypothetical protein
MTTQSDEQFLPHNQIQNRLRDLDGKLEPFLIETLKE